MSISSNIFLIQDYVAIHINHICLLCIFQQPACMIQCFKILFLVANTDPITIKSVVLLVFTTLSIFVSVILRFVLAFALQSKIILKSDLLKFFYSGKVISLKQTIQIFGNLSCNWSLDMFVIYFCLYFVLLIIIPFCC